MLAECAILSGSAKVLNDTLTIEAMKAKKRDLTDSEKQEFIEDEDRRFLHFTSKESAEQIMKSGFLLPTKGVVKNHFTRQIENSGKSRNMESVYMFDNKTLNVDDYIRNLPKSRSPYNGCFEYYAVSTKPNKHEIENFQKRAYDGAILYDGRMDIDGTDTKLTKFVLDLDKEGKYKFNEVPLEFEYTPNEDLMNKLKQDRQGVLKYTIKTYMSEIKKAKAAQKKYKAEKQEYKEDIAKKKEFAKVNKQFKEEEQDKSYIFEENGRTLVVKNLEYDMVDGKKLQKLAMIENSKENKDKELAGTTKVAYMDEFDLSKIEPEVAKKYFFSNYDNIQKTNLESPEYIGLPLQDLETGNIENEYDESFKKAYDAKIQRKEYANKEYEKYSNSKKFSTKIKNFFNKIFGKKNDIKLLESEQEKDRKKLAELGYSSIEAMNKDDKEITILSELQSKTYPPHEVTEYDKKQLLSDKTKDVRTREVNGQEQIM